MPSVLLWACLAENLFLFAAQKNLRIFLSCFFTGRGRGSQRMLHALERRSHPADHGPSFASLFPPLAAVSSTAIPVRVKLKTPRANAAAATTVDIPTGWNPNTKKEPTGLFFAACGRPCSFDSSYGLHETATTLDIPSRWDPRANQSPTGALVAVLRTAALFDSRTGQIKNPPSECSRDFYDPYGNRTHVTAVKGPCLNRLTNGP